MLPEGPGIELRDERGKTRLMLSFQKNGDSHITLANSQGEPVLSVGTVESKGVVGYVTIRDKKREEHVNIAVSDTGTPSIVLTGHDGKSRAMLFITPNSNTLGLHDSEGRPRLVLCIGPEDVPELCFFSELGKKRASFAHRTAQTGFVIYDSHEKRRVLASVDTDERPWLSIADSSDTPRVKVMMLPDGSPGIVLNDAAGRQMVVLTSRPDSPGLILCDPTGKARAILTLGPEGPSLVLTDESGEATFHAP